MWDQIVCVHRLNEHFAACNSFAAAESLAGSLVHSVPGLGGALVTLLSECDELVELVVQLMQSLCVHADGAALLAKSGALPVLGAMLRADEPLLRAHGLALLATLSERPELARPLMRAGALKLVTFIARQAMQATAAASATGSAAVAGPPQWPLLLEIAEGLLRTPTAVPTPQRQQLRDVLAQAAFAHKAGHLPLELHDGRRLTRLLFTLRALALSDPKPGQRASRAAPAAAVGLGGMSTVAR